MAYRIYVQSERIEIWVSGDVTLDALDALVRRYKKTGVLVVVYKSGRGNLGESTADLLQAQVG